MASPWYIQGGPSGRGKPPIDLDLGCSTILGRDSQEKKIIEKIIVKLIEKFVEICYTGKMKKLE